MVGERTTEVVVVGAGPAGSAAAMTLARLGRQVTLVDKAAFPRDKCCGDGLTTAALRRLEALGLDPRSVASWQPVDEVVVVPSGGSPVALAMPAGGDSAGTLFAASARRTDLDAALVEMAEQAGAEVVTGEAVRDVTEAAGGSRVSVELAGGNRILASFVVAADGMWSPVRKALGLGTEGYLGEWQAGRRYFSGVGPAARKLWVWFEPDMLPGYAWSFPLPGGQANVGYGVLRHAGVGPAGHPAGPRGGAIDFLDRPHIAEVLGPGASPAGPWRAWPIPARIGKAALHGLDGRVLFAGDAAGACDPMTGEGIAQALETGELAARVIARAGPHRPGDAATRYQRQVRLGLAMDDRLSRLLSAVLARSTGSARALAIVDRSDWGRRNFVRWMFEDYPRAVPLTPHRWHRGVFTSPGAYPGQGRTATDPNFT